MNLNTTSARPEDNAYNIQRGRSTFRTSTNGPHSNSPSPMDDSFPPLEVDYAERVATNYNMDIEITDPSLPSAENTTCFSFSLPASNPHVMNIEWDYSYYQPWSDNEWLIDEMMAMQEEALMAQNEDITMQWCIECQSILGDNGLVVWTRLFWETSDYFPFYFWTCAKWDNIGLTHY